MPLRSFTSIKSKKHNESSVQRGIVAGIIPLVLLLSLLLVTFFLVVLARTLSLSAGFFAQQQVVLIILIVGLTFSSAIYAIAIWRVLRSIKKAFQQKEKPAYTTFALLTLGCTSLIVFLPLLFAIFLPQHPAP